MYNPQRPNPYHSNYDVPRYNMGNPYHKNNMYQDSPCYTPRYQYPDYRYSMPTPDKKREKDYYLSDYGPEPFIVNIEEATIQNKNFRTALWTGEHLQLTLMSIDVGDDIGLEIHPNVDQFIRIEEGEGLTVMGDRKDRLDIQKKVYDDFVIFVPAGKWHNLINIGDKPLKIYSIYAPPEHPHGTVHRTKRDAEAAEKEHDH